MWINLQATLTSSHTPEQRIDSYIKILKISNRKFDQLKLFVQFRPNFARLIFKNQVKLIG